MNPIELRGLQKPLDIELGPQKKELQAEKSNGSFSEMLSRAINGVDQTMKDSDKKVEDFIAGRTDNVSDVMISMQRAQLSFQLMVEMRNKVVEAYQEISRMQI